MRRQVKRAALCWLGAALCAAASAASGEQPGVTRQIPGTEPPLEQAEPPPEQAEPPPEPNVPHDFLPVEDRWRIMESLGRGEHWYDPYNFNWLKADRPVFGEHWFVNARLVSDSLFEPRRLPTPVGSQATRRRGSLDVFGEGEQYLAAETLIGSISLIEGNTVFRPPDWEIRVTGAWNGNHLRAEEVGLVNIDPERGIRRTDDHFGLQEAFVDRHIANVSDRYDFWSVRAGIQTFQSDFRGFLFADSNPGIRFFGNYLNNRLQWNLAAFRRVEKDTNSGLNTFVNLRPDDVYVANLYFQDFPVLGFTLQGTVVHNRNDEGGAAQHYDSNGFLQRPAPVGSGRPHDYQVTYLGLNGDGHLGRLNLTFAAYLALGEDERNPIPDRKVDITSGMVAAEASVDFDWLRTKAFALWASGDEDPFDGDATGWDPIFENPNFAGAETGFWQRQAIPFIAGGGVILSGRNALIPSLRTSKEEGQSNFVNPGLWLIGVGGDFDVLPELRLVTNASWLAFDDTSVLQVLRNQGPIDREIGWDVSAALVYRPLFTENVVLRLSGAVLFPGDGLHDLFDDGPFPLYSVLANVVLSY